MANTSRRKHATTRNQERKLRLTLPGGCSLTYLQLAGDYTRGMIAVLPAISGTFNYNGAYLCLKLRVFSPAIAGILLANFMHFYLRKQAILNAIRE